MKICFHKQVLYWIEKNDSPLGNLHNSLFSEFDLINSYVIYLWGTCKTGFYALLLEDLGSLYSSVTYEPTWLETCISFFVKWG